MNNIITLTMNPAVDKDTFVAGVVPKKKAKLVFERYWGRVSIP